MNNYKSYFNCFILSLLFIFMKCYADNTNNNSILLNAEPFGFGPASIISQLASNLKQHYKKVGYIGEGFTLDLQQEKNYQDIIKLPSKASEKQIREEFKKLRATYSYFFSASDFNYARIAKEEGFIVGMYDPLTWFWQELPPIFKKIDLYVAQNFVGVKERLAQLNKPPKQINIIPSITPSCITNTNKKQSRQVFINLGGLSNSFITNNLLIDFTYTLSKNLSLILPKKFIKSQFATSHNFLTSIPAILNPSTLTFPQVMKNLQTAEINLMTPGLGNIFESASANAAVIWLMPMNDSQGQQLKLLEREQLIDWSIDWHDFTDNTPINYFKPQHIVMQQINKNINDFINRADYQENFLRLLQQKLAEAEKQQQLNNNLKLSSVIDKFGNNGMDNLISILLQWTNTKKNNKTLASSYIWKIGGDLTIKFESDVGFNWSEKDTIEFGAHLPELELCTDQNITADFTIKHHFSNSNSIELTQSNNQLDIFSAWKQQLPADFLHLLYGVCRKLWLTKNIFPVHGALVTKDNQHYQLIIGPPGSGKTSLTLLLAQQGYKIFSGDKTLIKIDDQGAMHAIAGTKTMTLRQQDEDKLKSIKYDKLYKNNERLLLKVNTNNKTYAPIETIHFITLNEGFYYHEEVTKLSSLHKLYPFFMDKQREDILIGEDKAILDGNINTKIKQQLAKNLKKSLLSIPVYRTIGSLEELVIVINNNKQNNTQKPTTTATKKNILIGICGIGNGHINRQIPLIKHLLQANHQVIIFTYAQGLISFQQLLDKYKNLQVVEVANPYIVGTPTGLDFLQAANHQVNSGINFFNKNMLAMHQVAQKFNKPDLVITDYEAISAQYAYSKNCPLITLDQQSKYLIGELPKNLNGTSYIDEIERLSMFFPKAQQRIALSFFNVDKKINDNYKVTVLPPILKDEIIKAKNTPLTKKPSLLVYLSSQQMCDFLVEDWEKVLTTEALKTFTVNFFIPKSQKLPANYNNINFYHHGDNAFNNILFSCHGIISTAGHSLLSEAMYLEKPVYAIPVALYEQQMNAYVIATGNFGIADINLNSKQLKIFINNLELYRNNIKNDKSLLLKSGKNHQLIPLINNIINDL